VLVIAAEDFVAAVVEVTALLLICVLLNIDVGVLPLSNTQMLPLLLGRQRAGAFDLVVCCFWFLFFLAVFCTGATHVHAAHAIIFGVASRFLSPVKKMLRVFAMLYDFFARDSFFFKRFQKVVPSLIAHRESA
jgi:enoyl-CoA hydratase/carnithine racemase